jgi:hypothetical protein
MDEPATEGIPCSFRGWSAWIVADEKCPCWQHSVGKRMIFKCLFEGPIRRLHPQFAATRVPKEFSAAKNAVSAQVGCLDDAAKLFAQVR